MRAPHGRAAVVFCFGKIAESGGNGAPRVWLPTAVAQKEAHSAIDIGMAFWYTSQAALQEAKVQ